ncbi:MAG: hypothetical protein FJ034_01985 [Chloroflexi bacterium]|nr:hypothetical protein [Chloroflexota bacterium]
MRAFLLGSTTVTRTRWTSRSTWRPGFATLGILVAGLVVFGIGQTLQVQAGLGNAPWTVLAQGIALRLGLDLGFSVFLVSAAVLAIWIPFRERPGLGTILNATVVSATLSAGTRLIPPATETWVQLATTLAGVALTGIGSGIYLTCGTGPGPRDGLMTLLHHHTGMPIARVRLGLEVSAVTAGWLLGGTVGLGTVLFALLVGRSVAFSLGLAARVAPATQHG